MHKLAKGISLTILQEIVKIKKKQDNLRSQNSFEIPFRNSVYSVTESISYLGPKLWEPV